MWVCLSVAVSFNNSVKMLSAGFLPCKVTIFHFDINKSFVGIFTETKFLIDLSSTSFSIIALYSLL